MGHCDIHSISLALLWQVSFLLLSGLYTSNFRWLYIFLAGLKNSLCIFFPSTGGGTKSGHYFSFLLSTSPPAPLHQERGECHRHLLYCVYAGGSSGPDRWYAKCLQCPV